MTRSIPIVALDVASAAQALAMARSVGAGCRFFKVGSELFTSAGPAVVRALQDELAADVFLDLKFHDIPNTVSRAVRGAVSLGIRLVTVHASGGQAMLEAAQDAATSAPGASCGVMAVTVLTSLDAAGVATAWGRSLVNVEAEVLRLAADAHAAGLHGIVCSGAEAAAVRATFGDDLATLVPGIRFADGVAHDQRRVLTAAAAQAAGAQYIVLGRAVTEAADPSDAMRRVLDELSPDASRAG